jgi:epoxyqueuosine reductase
MRADVTSRDADLRSIIDGFIRDYLEVPANNHLGPGSEGKAWVDVLVGFSSGADPLYQDLKEHVGPFHWTPLEAFRLAGCSAADDTGGADDPSVESPAADTQAGATGPAIAGLSAASDPVADPGSGVAAEDLTVVSWALCQSEEAKESNSREARYPSETWARARMFGQECNNALHTSLLAALKEAGYPAVAPALLPEWSQQPSERFFIASSWSERHVAHVSGLGTFGLTGGLLTEKGQAVRLGSVVVQARLAATPRRYSGPFD